MRIGARQLPLGTAVYALVVVAVAVGLAVLAVGPWRLGMSMCGGAFAAAAVARIAIPERTVGLLRVRRRVIDVLWMAALAGMIITLAIVIPSQPAP